MRIDAHQHFWQRSQPFDYQWLTSPELGAINRDFMPGDLAPRAKAARIDASVFVQTQHNPEETRWILDLVQDSPLILGVVGWVDLAEPSSEATLESFLQHPRFVGIRHITQDEPDDDFIVRPEILAGLKMLEKHGVPFDLLFYSKHLKHAPTVAAHVPDLPLVIDHLSKPQIKAREHQVWARELQAAAAHDNVHCKLSGMITEADWESWTVNDLRPYVETALECFGPNRCMFGSDWPVCELAGTYQQVVEAMDELLSELSETERKSIYCDTAKEFYGLTLPDAPPTTAG